MNQLQTVLDALETAFEISGSQEIPLMESAITIVKQMMQAVPVAWHSTKSQGLIAEGQNEGFVNKIICATARTQEYSEPLFAAPQAETRTLYECRSCGHLYNEKVSSCDCMENKANEYNEWTATPKD